MSPQIDLGEWTPDMPKVGLAPSLVTCKNVTPREAGYGPFPSWATLSVGALTAYCRGAFSGKKADGTEFLIAGDATKLYAAVSGSLTDLGGTFNNTTDVGWSFCQYGERVVAVNLADAPQSWDFTTLADLSANASKAKYCATVRKFVVLGNIVGRGLNVGIGTIPYGLHWSAYDNPTSWLEVATAGAKAVQSDYQALKGEAGQIQGIVGGVDYGVVFQERAITRMEYVGGDLFFQLYPVERGRGAMIPGSIVSIGSLVFYAAEDGFFVFNGQTSTPIGFGKIDRTVFSDMDAGNTHRWSSAILPESGIVCWLYPGAGNTSGTPNKLLLYNYKAQKWATCDFTGEQLVRATQAGFILDNLNTSLDDISVNLDTYGPPARPTTLGAFDSSHTMGSFSGASMAAQLETGDAELDAGRVSTVHGVRPVYDASAGSGGLLMNVRTSGRMTPDASTSFGAYTLPNGVGICPQRKSGRYHRVSIATSGEWDRLYGLDVRTAPAGVR